MVADPIGEGRKKLISPDFKPSIIQISAAYDSEHAHVLRGTLIFTDSLKRVWDGGRFSGTHSDFAEQIRAVMREDFKASETGFWYQEPRYLQVGPDKGDLAVFDQAPPFSIGRSRLG